MIKTPLSTVIGGAFWTPGATVINGKGIFSVFVKSLFADGTQGIYLNAQDAASVSDLSSIKDLSGRGNHAVQANATSRASLVTDPSGYKSLKFDGIDDWYVAQSINLTNASSVTVIAAVRKLADNTTAIAVELGSPATSVRLSLQAPSSGSAKDYLLGTGFGSFRYGTAGGYAAPISSVLTIRADRLDSLLNLRANGTSFINTVSNIGAENLGNYPLYIGRRGGTSNPFNGQIYALLIIGKLLDDATTAKIEKEFAKYIGVTL